MRVGRIGTPITPWLVGLRPPALYFRNRRTHSSIDPFLTSFYQGWIIIDEVQKIPALLNIVHRLIEHRQQKFILTGSSARSLRQKGVNLQRALTYHMHPLTPLELGADHNLKHPLLAYRLPVFTRRSKRNVIAHQKFYYFDVGVYRAIRPRGPLDNNQELDSPALETLFLRQLKAINDYFDRTYAKRAMLC